MFNFIVRYLGFLKHVPLLTWMLDALMMLWTFLFHRDIARAIEYIELKVEKWKGIKPTIHRFGGLQFDFGNREIGHVHSNGTLDILFSKKTKQCLLKHALVNNHHTFNNSGWISFQIRSEKDTTIAIMLLQLAYKHRIAESDATEFHPAPTTIIENSGWAKDK